MNELSPIIEQSYISWLYLTGNKLQLTYNNNYYIDKYNKGCLMTSSRLATLIFIFCSSAYSNATLAQSADDWESGKQIFDNICQHCHTQKVGPVLTGRNLPAVFYTTIARNGLNAMPAFRPTELSDADLEKVGQYLSQSSGENP